MGSIGITICLLSCKEKEQLVVERITKTTAGCSKGGKDLRWRELTADVLFLSLLSLVAAQQNNSALFCF